MNYQLLNVFSNKSSQLLKRLIVSVIIYDLWLITSIKTSIKGLKMFLHKI